MDNNIIIGNPKLINSKIEFVEGVKNNILYCEDNVVLENSNINFKGSNSVVFLSENRHTYFLHVTAYNNSTLYLGKNNYMNKRLHIILSEGKNVIVGEECLFALGCWIRTADPHIIYNVETKLRINNSKNVIIGDHIWCGQDVLILKGSQIGSGCIIGARAVVSGKRLNSNSVYAGNPIRCVKDNVFHSKKSVNDFTNEDTEKYNKFIDDRYIYSYDKAYKGYFEELDHEIGLIKDSNKRIEYIKENLCIPNKNRFFIGIVKSDL